MSSRTFNRIFAFAGLFGIVLPSVFLNGQGPILVHAAASLLSAAAVHLVLHEAGHAGAALAVGLRVDRVVIGGGPRLLRVPIGDAVVEINAFPGSGFVVPALPSADVELDRARWRFLMIWSAGPIVTALMTFLGTDVIRWLSMLGDGQPSPFSLRFARDIYLVGLVFLAQSALPIQRDSDGRVILELLTGSKAKIADRVALVATSRIIRRGQEGDIDGALRLPEASGTAPQTRSAVASVLMMGERYDEAVEILSPLASDDLSEEVRIAVWINLAFAATYSSDAEAAMTAEIHTSQLNDTLPKRHPHRPMATVARGYVLVFLDRHEEALSLFNTALGRELPAELDADALAGRSLARLGIGDVEGAVNDVEQARRRKASTPGVRLAERSIKTSPLSTATENPG